MPKASDIKKGQAIEFNGKTLIIKHIDYTTPSARGAGTIFRFKMTDVVTGYNSEETFKSDTMIPFADLTKVAISFSYIDGDEYIFMNNEDYTQYIFKKDEIETELPYITEAIQGLYALVIDGTAVALELPQSVVMTISDTAPSIKGASASARTKPAQFDTGLIIQVPEYVANGDSVKINTADKKFMSRA